MKFLLLQNKTQKEIAKELGLSPQTLNNYVNGKTEPSIETLCKLADYYHVTLDYLVGRQFANDIGYLSQPQQNLLTLIKKLDNNQCSKLEAYIYGLIDAKEEFTNNKQNNNYKKA